MIELLPTIADAVPDPVKTSFFKAAGNLLGGLAAVPAAKLKQYAQSIEDTTSMRSQIAAAAAKAVADKASEDAVILQAATEAYLPTTVRKIKNRLEVTQKAAEHLQEAADQSGGASDPAPPEDDWMNAFMRFSEDASSAQLQDLFARILAGQVVRPGAFSLATLRAVSELDQSIADDFSILWARSVGDAIDNDEELKLGEQYSRLQRVAEAGLISGSSSGRYPPPFAPEIDGYSKWTPMHVGGVFLNVYYPDNYGHHWSHVSFTRVGMQIGGIIARPDYVGNMRKAGRRLLGKGVSRIELHMPGKVPELLTSDP